YRDRHRAQLGRDKGGRPSDRHGTGGRLRGWCSCHHRHTGAGGSSRGLAHRAVPTAGVAHLIRPTGRRSISSTRDGRLRRNDHREATRPIAARLGDWLQPTIGRCLHLPQLSSLATADPAVAELVEAEAVRQADSVRLIASENYVSQPVLEATGSVLTNKYSEGYAGRRYYEGQQVIDPLETLTIERATSLFGTEHANV